MRTNVLVSLKISFSSRHEPGRDRTKRASGSHRARPVSDTIAPPKPNSGGVGPIARMWRANPVLGAGNRQIKQVQGIAGRREQVIVNVDSLVSAEPLNELRIVVCQQIA